MGSFITPGDTLWGNDGVDHGFLRQQPQGVRQRDAIAEHSTDNGFTLHHRGVERFIDKPFLLKLLAEFGEQRLLVHRPVNHPKMRGVEELIQHPWARTVDQHQLANLVQLIIRGER